jgi:hypothetical protein
VRKRSCYDDAVALVMFVRRAMRIDDFGAMRTAQLSEKVDLTAFECEFEWKTAS